MSIDTSYPAILKLFGDFKVKGLKEHQAFLAWFLQSYYRLEGSDVDDAICDQQGDKGIDGIYVNHVTQEVDVFQARMATANSGKGLGDHEVKELAGTLDFFKNEQAVRHLAEVTPSPALRKLLEQEQVAHAIAQGYKPRGIFVTTRKRDVHTTDFLKVRADIVLYDEIELKARYLAIGKADPISKPITFYNCRFGGVGARDRWRPQDVHSRVECIRIGGNGRYREPRIICLEFAISSTAIRRQQGDRQKHFGFTPAQIFSSLS